MQNPKAAFLVHTDAMRDCPMLDAATHAQFRAALKASNVFSLAVLEFMQKKTPKQQAAWLRTSVGASRALFQPWSMEIVYVVASLGRARFTQLHDLLGLSTRTLSDKLRTLREVGLMDRQVFDEQPVRIEYFLTKKGLRAAALASPLFAHLAHEAMAEAGR